MREINILEVHQQCLDFLLSYQMENTDFFFIPRKNNNKGRLKKGMYFRGNSDYLALTFWDSADTKEFLYNINFAISNKGEASAVLSCRDDEKKLKYILEIKALLEKNGLKFELKKENRWNYFYSNNMSYMDALQNFILNIKPLIDKYLLEHKESGIPLANKTIDDKYVKKLPGYSNFIVEMKKAKKTGSVIVKPSEYIMNFLHNELSNEMVIYLKSNGYKGVVTDKKFIDIQAKDCYGQNIYFELKTAITVKLAIRQALGQLLEYNHYPIKNNADKLIIVTPHKPDKEDMDYLRGLREHYNIPIWYCQFDMTEKVLSKEF